MTVQILQGDCRETLKQLPDGCCQTCVTSPPYYGLRDYGVDGQMGLEESPELYVASLLQVFREVWRVLKPDGTLWLNLGDSYAGSGKGGQSEEKRSTNWQPTYANHGALYGMKPKDLLGIPWRVATALQYDGCADTKAVQVIETVKDKLISHYTQPGTSWLPSDIIYVLDSLEKEYQEAKGNSWYLRSDIIWAKPNPMPESVMDRPTKSHEYIFLLAKQPRYYYDAEAIKIPSIEPEDNRGERGNRKRFPTEKVAGIRGPGIYPMANRRDVWTVTTKPYKEAHFATFPPDLIEPCILAGTSEKGECPKCGKAWERVVEKEKPPAEVYARNGKPESIAAVSHPELGKVGMGQKLQDWYNKHPATTKKWQPTCDSICACGGHTEFDEGRPRLAPVEPIPQTVLDPFGGSGTTGAVATKHNRNAILCELNPAYIELIHKRLAEVQPVLV